MICNLNFKLDSILFITVFWCYGIYAAGSNPNFGLNYNIILTLIIVAYLFIINKTLSPITLNFSFKFNYNYIILSFLLVFSLLYLSLDNLRNDLVWDQLTHFRSSNIYAIKLFNSTMLFDNLYSKHFLYVINLIILIIISIIFYFYNNYKSLLSLTIVCSLFLSIRLFYILIRNGNGEPYPPFRGILYNISSALLGISSMSYRIVGVFILLISIIKLYSIINKFNNKFIVILFILNILSLDLLITTASMAEQSIFTFCILLIFMFKLISHEFSLNDHYSWLSILAISALVRSPIFIVLSIYLSYLLFLYNYSTKEKFKFFLIYLIVLPWYIQAFTFGSNANYLNGFSKYIPYDNFSLMRIYFILKNNIAIDLWIQSLSISIIFIFIITPFIIFLFIKGKLKYLINIIYFSLILVFLSLRTDHLGWQRYYIEYILPFYLLSVYLLLKFISKYSIKLAIIFIIFNIYLNCSNYKTTLNYAVKFNIQPLAEELFDITVPIRYVEKKFGLDNLMLLSVTYGEGPYILSDLKIKDIKNLVSSKNKFIKFSEFDQLNPIDLNAINEINTLIVADFQGDKNNLFNNLIMFDWKVDKIYTNNSSNNKTYIFHRN